MIIKINLKIDILISFKNNKKKLLILLFNIVYIHLYIFIFGLISTAIINKGRNVFKFNLKVNRLIKN